MEMKQNGGGSTRKWKQAADFSTGKAITNGTGHPATVQRYNQQYSDIGQW